MLRSSSLLSDSKQTEPVLWGHSILSGSWSFLSKQGAVGSNFAQLCLGSPRDPEGMTGIRHALLAAPTGLAEKK